METLKKLLLKLRSKKQEEKEPNLMIQKESKSLQPHNIQDLNEYLEWRNKLRLGSVDDETFLQILNTRF